MKINKQIKHDFHQVSEQTFKKDQEKIGRYVKMNCSIYNTILLVMRNKASFLPH